MQGELITAHRPKIPELPLKQENNHQHFNSDDGRGDPGEQAYGQTDCHRRLSNIGQIGQRFRERQPFGGDIRGKFSDRNIQHFLDSVRHQNCASSKAHEGIRERRKASVEARQPWENKFRFALCNRHCILPQLVLPTPKRCKTRI